MASPHIDQRSRRPQFPNKCNVRIPRMRWVHRYRRHGAYLALVALALQIVLSFGHVDLGGIIGPTHLTLAGKQNTTARKRSPGQLSPVAMATVIAQSARRFSWSRTPSCPNRQNYRCRTASNEQYIPSESIAEFPRRGPSSSDRAPHQPLKLAVVPIFSIAALSCSERSAMRARLAWHLT